MCGRNVDVLIVRRILRMIANIIEFTGIELHVICFSPIVNRSQVKFKLSLFVGDSIGKYNRVSSAKLEMLENFTF